MTQGTAGSIKFVEVLAQSGATVTAPADTAENTLFTYTLPGGTMGPNDLIEITPRVTETGSGNSKTWKLYFGTSLILNGAQTTNTHLFTTFKVANRNSLASQVASSNTWSQFGVSTTAPQTFTIDTSADVVIKLTATKASGAETAQLEDYSILLLRAV